MILLVEYYFIFENWVLDANQWSILLSGVAVLLTLIGFGLAFRIYKIQRQDNALESFDFFQASLPELKIALESTILNIETFIRTLESDNFSNPILSAALNDKFLNKINILDLSRHFSLKRKSQKKYFQQLLVDTNFFGNYHSYFTEEINYIRDNYLNKEDVYSDWQLLRSNKLISILADSNEKDVFKETYLNWYNQLHSDKSVFEFDKNGEPTKVKNREKFEEILDNLNKLI
jgi:hypothetical protein